MSSRSRAKSLGISDRIVWGVRSICTCALVHRRESLPWRKQGNLPSNSWLTGVRQCERIWSGFDRSQAAARCTSHKIFATFRQRSATTNRRLGRRQVPLSWVNETGLKYWRALRWDHEPSFNMDLAGQVRGLNCEYQFHFLKLRHLIEKGDNDDEVYLGFINIG